MKFFHIFNKKNIKICLIDENNHKYCIISLEINVLSV